MYLIAIHGGAETLTESDLTPEEKQQYLVGLETALNAGYAVLQKGGTALDAVEQAVRQLEDNELFNAGKGAAFTLDEQHELEAAIMDGRTLEAGAVAGVSNVRNPISLARTIKEQSEHVFMIGDGAEAFAKEHHIDFMPDNYFFSQERLDQLQEQKASEPVRDTVGAVALDKDGNLAAATSTGGLTGQLNGRVGDSPIIGGGTYANNRTCAVSCTGDGEFIMRSVAAYDVSCLVEYAGLSLKDACQRVILDKVKALGGDAGLVAVDTSGNVELVYNCASMFRAWRNHKGEGEIKIFK